jgi:hypothetical protein
VRGRVNEKMKKAVKMEEIFLLFFFLWKEIREKVSRDKKKNN